MIFWINFSTFLLVVLAGGLGIHSLARNPKSTVVRLWFFLSLAVALWGIGYILTNMADNEVTAARHIRVVYFAASLIPVLFFHFIVSFIYKTNKFSFLLAGGYLLAAVFLILNFGTNYVIKGVRQLPDLGYYEEITAPGFYFFLVYFFFFALYAIWLLLKEYQHSDGIRRRQILYLILASVVGFIGGGSNFLADLTGAYPYGQLLVWLYPVLITYGIFTPLQIKITQG